MYKYEFERVNTYLRGWELRGNVYNLEDYQEIIAERALKGWKFVTCIPAVQSGNGVFDSVDLVFEKPAEE